MVASRERRNRKNRLQQEIHQLRPWFHNIHLPDGTQTAPDHKLGDFPAYKWKEIEPHLPQDLTGWSVLDIGCNAGFYSIELAARGAKVTGIDSNPNYLAQARWALEHLPVSGRVDFRLMQLYDLARDEERYDLILFLGVFYHLRYPLLALDLVSRKVNRFLVFQTLIIPGNDVVEDSTHHDLDDREHMLAPGWPKMAFIENRFANDPTNWWAPNHACVMAMLRSTGLKVVAQPGKEVYLCRPSLSARPDEEFWIEQYESVIGLSGRRTAADRSTP
jgi:tRNA (mo5U34)-methyltransferase